MYVFARVRMMYCLHILHAAKISVKNKEIEGNYVYMYMG